MNPDVTRILSILAQTASQQPPHTPPPPDPRLQHLQNSPQLHADPAPAPPVDPKTITDWPTALKYVMNTLGKDEAVMAQIKKVRFLDAEHEQEGLIASADEEAPTRPREAVVSGLAVFNWAGPWLTD